MESKLASEPPPLPTDSQAETLEQWRREAPLMTRGRRDARRPWLAHDPDDRESERIFEVKLNEHARALLKAASARNRRSMHREAQAQLIGALERELGVVR